jgi:hypothetical protein
VHLVYDPVPLHSCLANKKATEQSVSLLGLFDLKGFLGLVGLIEVAELLLSRFLLDRTLFFMEVEEGAHLLPDFYQHHEGVLDFGSCSFLLNQPQNGDDVDEVFLVVSSALGGHLELCPIRKFNLYLLGFLLLVEISWGNIRDGWPNGRHALLAFGVFQAFWRGLEA